MWDGVRVFDSGISGRMMVVLTWFDYSGGWLLVYECGWVVVVEGWWGGVCANMVEIVAVVVW